MSYYDDQCSLRYEARQLEYCDYMFDDECVQSLDEDEGALPRTFREQFERMPQVGDKVTIKVAQERKSDMAQGKKKYIEQRIRQLELELVKLQEQEERFGEDSDYKVGHVIGWTAANKYVYLAIKTPVGWYTTASQRAELYYGIKKILTFTELVEILMRSESTDIKRVKSWKTL